MERERKPALPGLVCSALPCLPSCLPACLPAWGYHIIIASFISLFINIHVALPFTQMAITLTLTLTLTLMLTPERWANPSLFAWREGGQHDI